jgi:hypothetical protein
VRRALVARGAKIFAEKTVLLRAVPGRALDLQMEDTFGFLRVYCATRPEGRRVYQVMAFGTSAQASPDIVRYLDSFRLTD